MNQTTSYHSKKLMLIVPSKMEKAPLRGVCEYGSSMYRFFFDESKIVAVGSENIAHDSGGLGINFRIGLKDLAQTSILRRLN
jgi:hypothetical protein